MQTAERWGVRAALQAGTGLLGRASLTQAAQTPLGAYDQTLIQGEELGPGVCHDGYRSCFYRTLQNDQWAISEEKTYDPNAVYKN